MVVKTVVCKRRRNTNRTSNPQNFVRDCCAHLFSRSQRWTKMRAAQKWTILYVISLAWAKINVGAYPCLKFSTLDLPP